MSLPYSINYSEFKNVSEDDPRYIFKEVYEPDTKCCKFTCVVKPFRERKEVYRILNFDFIKIMSIDPMIEVDSEEFKRLRKNK